MTATDDFPSFAPEDDRIRPRGRFVEFGLRWHGAFAAKDLTVGVVYVGARDDFGWNQAHAVAIKSLKEVPGVKVVEEENVPETDAVSKSMESMINLDGAGLILATSFGYYTPFVVDLAKNIPTSSSVTPRRSGIRTRIRKTPAPISATSTRRIT